jgi:MFS family permease
MLQLGSMLLFIVAQSVAFLFAARILQGQGRGLASGAITAWMLDPQPPDEPRLGGFVSGIALIAGLALGALGSSLLAQYAPDPLHLVFWLLAAFYVVALVAIARMPDLVQRRPGWLRTVRPEVAVPASARSTFAATAPSLVAAWAVAGFYLSLGPSLAISLVSPGSRLTGGLVIVALLGAAAVASFAVRASEPGPTVVRGSLVLIVGVALTLLSVALGSIVGLFVASAIAGLGFGPAFSGVFRSVTALAPPDRRGALLAAVYIVVYLAFSVPTILAGVSVALYGLRPTTYAFGLIVIGLAGMTTLAISRRVTSAATGKSYFRQSHKNSSVA